MRVYELAKKLGMESRTLIPALARLGIKVTSHSNTLDEETTQRACEALQGEGKFVNPPELDKQAHHVGHKEGKGGKKEFQQEISHKDTSKGHKLPFPTPQEEPKKPEKKRVLIKRKKEDEDQSTQSLEDQMGPSLTEAPLQSPHIQAITPSIVESPAPSTSPLWQEQTISTGPTLSEAPVIETVPETTIGLELSKTEDIQANAKIKKPEPDEATIKDTTEEKIKKPKKVGKAQNEDLFAARYEDAARWQDLRPLPTLRREERARHFQPTAVTEITKPRKKVIKLEPGITVKEFAELLGQRPTEVIRKLMEVGLGLTLNQPMNLDAGTLIAEGLGINVEVSTEKEGEALLEEALEERETQTLKPRAPVVTIMGHVDHGKTSLLDAIRQTQVTDQEAGGITQHIGAYSIHVGGKRITFLDTPGHEAFTAMRARGAQVTDIVVLVVAADDGVMPQTIEAIHHAQAAQVPIIVAVNKIDKPGANPDRVKQGLADHGLLPESWGGQTIFVEVSAKQKQGLDQLLEMILLQAEVMELQANVACSARGTVLESRLDRGRGPVATVLVQAGTLQAGKIFVVGSTSGRVRALNSDSGVKLKEAGPSTPVEVIGLLGVPAAGSQFAVVKDERSAREIAQARQHKQRLADMATGGARRTLDDLYSADSEVKTLYILVKGDVQGSVGALCESIEKISTDAVKLRIVHSGVGGISESDVLLAAASKALIIGFHVRPEQKASALAEREGVEIRLYTVIYNVIEEIKAAAEGLLAPTLKERIQGRAEVRQVFTVPKVGTIAGCYVNDGLIARSSSGVRIVRDHIVVYESKVGSLRRFKEDVREVQPGYECGIGIENFNDIKVGDIIESFIIEEEAAKL